MLVSTPNEDSYSWSSISSPMVTESRSRIGGDESAAYVVSDDTSVDVLSSIQICFGLVSEPLNLGVCLLGG